MLRFSTSKLILFVHFVVLQPCLQPVRVAGCPGCLLANQLGGCLLKVTGGTTPSQPAGCCSFNVNVLDLF